MRALDYVEHLISMYEPRSQVNVVDLDANLLWARWTAVQTEHGSEPNLVPVLKGEKGVLSRSFMGPLQSFIPRMHTVHILDLFGSYRLLLERSFFRVLLVVNTLSTTWYEAILAEFRGRKFVLPFACSVGFT